MMSKNVSREVKQYINAIRKMLPLKTKQEKAFIRNLKSHILDYIEYHNNCTIDDIIDNFGLPEDIVESYISQFDGIYLSNSISQTRKKRILCEIIIYIVILTSLIGIIFLATNNTKDHDHSDDMLPNVHVIYEEWN